MITIGRVVAGCATAALTAVTLTACTAAPSASSARPAASRSSASATSRHSVPATTTPASASPSASRSPRILTVPTDLTGTSIHAAKATLTKLGFTNILVAGPHGGTITGEDTVLRVPEAGDHLTSGKRVRLIAKSSATGPPATGAHHSSTDTGSAGAVRYTCQPDAPATFGDPNHPNRITNKACGYTGSDGKPHSHDPWIEGQLKFDRCHKSGGHWDITSQSCKH